MCPDDVEAMTVPWEAPGMALRCNVVQKLLTVCASGGNIATILCFFIAIAFTNVVAFFLLLLLLCVFLLLLRFKI